MKNKKNKDKDKSDGECELCKLMFKMQIVLAGIVELIEIEKEKRSGKDDE